MRKIAILLAMICCNVHAQELFKWTDADGKVHIGDRSTAPVNSKKMDIHVQQSSGEPADTARDPKLLPANARSPDTTSIPVAPSRVGARCKGLADEIANVKPGVAWGSLARDFNLTCPGIAYECIEFRAHPENNKCSWVERTGGNFVNKKSYP